MSNGNRSKFGCLLLGCLRRLRAGALLLAAQAVEQRGEAVDERGAKFVLQHEAAWVRGVGVGAVVTAPRRGF